MRFDQKYCRAIMDAHWASGGHYTRPNPVAYPQQWLWDSCFHALIWFALGETQRSLQEMGSVFRGQRSSGFVPHVSYRSCGDFKDRMWSWQGGDYSCITQPPMYGHVLRVLGEGGLPVGALAERADRALWWLIKNRRRQGSRRLVILHPSESGAGTSPRFDSWNATARNHASWTGVKALLLSSVEVDEQGCGVRNPAFEVYSASFNALVAFNIAELVAVRPDRELARAGREIAEELDDCWVPSQGTWSDTSALSSAAVCVRTGDALLASLVSGSDAAVASALGVVTDPAQFWSPFGVPSVARNEPGFDASGYWRGSSWPPINYLLWLVAYRRGDQSAADGLARRALAGAERSGASEYFHPITGEALGARPQAWGCLPICMTGATGLPQDG